MPTSNHLENTPKKRERLSQSEFPNQTFAYACKIAQGLWDNFAGKSARPYDLAISLNISPTSGTWRNLCGASTAYGLTTGGYGASEISLTEMGRRIVAPTQENDDAAAKIQAVLKPRIMREFCQKYEKGKFPPANIAKNVLMNLGIPKERVDRSFSILEKNGRYAGIIRNTKTGPFVALDLPTAHSTSTLEGVATKDKEEDIAVAQVEDETPANQLAPLKQTKERVNRIFIAHGKEKKILGRLKDLIALVGLEPIVAQEHETSAKPVPEKVMDDMRNCQAAVIHVGSEGVLYDENGKEFPHINSNVLIEVGAAMALYKANYILLVEEGMNLPSNLQGLYECRYKGNELDGDTIMKLLGILKGFRSDQPRHS